MSEKITSSFVRRVELKGRKAWRGVLKYTDENGKSRQVSKTFGKDVRTKSQANAALALWKAEKEAEDAAPDGSLTVADYTRLYVDGLEKGVTVEASTIAGYRRIAKRIEMAQFSSVSMRDVTPGQIEKWRNSMLDEGLSPYTVGKYLRFLDMIFKRAVKRRDLLWNPCGAVDLPKVTKKAVTTLEMPEIARLHGILETMHPTPLVTAAYIGLYAGLREGEICGLRWCDVDLDTPSLTVNKAVGVGRGGAYVKNTKVDRPRTVQIVPQLHAAIIRRRNLMRASWKEIRLALGLPATDEAFNELYVIGDVRGGFKHPQLLSKEWRSFADNNHIIDNIGNRSTLHNLRHTFATVLIANGFEAVQVAKLLGHARPSMTLDIYAAAFEARGKMAMAAVAQTIGEAFERMHEPEVVTLLAASGK